MREIKFKLEMTQDELFDYWENWANTFITKNKNERIYLLNSNIYISVAKSNKTIIRVYGHNDIELGVFEPDRGNIYDSHGTCIYYYPILTFYNRLNQFGACYNCNTCNTKIERTSKGMIINEMNMLKAIQDSFNNLKIFEINIK